MPRALAQGRSPKCIALLSQAQVVCKQGLDGSMLKNADMNGRHLKGFHTRADFYSSARETPRSRRGRAAPSAPSAAPALPLTRRSPAPAPLRLSARRLTRRRFQLRERRRRIGRFLMPAECRRAALPRAAPRAPSEGGEQQPGPAAAP